MDFVETTDEAFWSYDEQKATALRRDGQVLTLASGSQTRGRWMPVLNALPEDRIEGHPQLLGPETYEMDLDYRDDVIIRSWPEADFSPEAFRRYAVDRAKRIARSALAESDWMVIRQVETGVPVPAEVVTAREQLREASDAAVARVDDLAPSEWPEYAPEEVAAAARAHAEVLQGLPV